MTRLSLEEQVKQALKIAQRAVDYIEIQNVMARHVFYFMAQRQWEELDTIWAKKAPDIAYGHDEGFKVVQESVKNYMAV